VVFILIFYLFKGKHDNAFTLNIISSYRSEYGLHCVSDAIATAIVDCGEDLLVVRTTNRSGLERFLVGLIAEQLVAKTNSSILLVRSPK